MTFNGAETRVNAYRPAYTEEELSAIYEHQRQCSLGAKAYALMQAGLSVTAPAGWPPLSFRCCDRCGGEGRFPGVRTNDGCNACMRTGMLPEEIGWPEYPAPGTKHPTARQPWNLNDVLKEQA